MPYVPSPRTRRARGVPGTGTGIGTGTTTPSPLPSRTTSRDNLITSSIDPLANDEDDNDGISPTWTSPSIIDRNNDNDNGQKGCSDSRHSAISTPMPAIPVRSSHDAFNAYRMSHYQINSDSNSNSNSNSNSPSPVPTPSEKQASPIDDNDQIPLSLSFIRKPSRSASMDVDIDRIMKRNTLMNSRMFDSVSLPTNIAHGISPAHSEEPQSPLSPLASMSNLHLNDSTASLGLAMAMGVNHYPLVRKKSGELVKSSLRLNSAFRSSGAASMPTTPLCNDKQVHFGDSNVKYFSQKDKPNSISAGNSPFNSDSEYFDDEEEDEDGSDESEEEHDLQYYGLTRADADVSNIFDTKHPLKELLRSCRKYDQSRSPRNLERLKAAVKDWNLDTTEFKLISYRDKIDCEVPVFLERCFLNLDKTMIVGQIAVKNMSFNKSVNVMYTVDTWKTVVNVGASYTSDIPRVLKRAGYDRFIFQISTHLLLSTYFRTHKVSAGNMVPNVEFCIKYSCCGQDFWDNNNMSNYKLTFYREKDSNPDSDGDHQDGFIDASVNKYPRKVISSPTPKKNTSRPDNYFSIGDAKAPSFGRTSDRFHGSTTEISPAATNDAASAGSSSSIGSSSSSAAAATVTVGVSESSSQGTLNNVTSTLKRSKSFDKRNNVKPSFESTGLGLQKTVPNACLSNSNGTTSAFNKEPSVIKLGSAGLKGNFQEAGFDTTNAHLKHENEYTLAKLTKLESEQSPATNADPRLMISDAPAASNLTSTIINGNDKVTKDQVRNSHQEILSTSTGHTGDAVLQVSDSGSTLNMLDGLDGVDKDAYKRLVEKYCFFKGPTAVSSFMAEEQEENKGVSIYTDKFY